MWIGIVVNTSKPSSVTNASIILFLVDELLSCQLLSTVGTKLISCICAEQNERKSRWERTKLLSLFLLFSIFHQVEMNYYSVNNNSLTTKSHVQNCKNASKHAITKDLMKLSLLPWRKDLNSMSRCKVALFQFFFTIWSLRNATGHEFYYFFFLNVKLCTFTSIKSHRKSQIFVFARQIVYPVQLNRSRSTEPLILNQIGNLFSLKPFGTMHWKKIALKPRSFVVFCSQFKYSILD